MHKVKLSTLFQRKIIRAISPIRIDSKQNQYVLLIAKDGYPVDIEIDNSVIEITVDMINDAYIVEQTDGIQTSFKMYFDNSSVIDDENTIEEIIMCTLGA